MDETASRPVSPETIRDHRHNNLDFLRLFFALTVIYSHSYPLIDGLAADTEPLVVRSRHQFSAGGLAVEFFFVISGFLITASFLSSKSIGSYVLKRALRIFPAYYVSVILCILAVVPIASTHLNLKSITALVGNGLILEPIGSPYTFHHNPFPDSINGAIWSIRYEFCCYILVIFLGMGGFLKKPSRILWLILAVTLLSSMTRVNIRFRNQHWLFGQWGAWCRFVRVFLDGACLYLWRKKIVIKLWYVFAAVAVAVGSIYVKPPELASLLLDLSATYVIFCIAFADWLPFQNFGRFGDFSYGTYLYGWPVQQMLVLFAAAYLSPLGLFASAGLISVGLGMLSWRYVEQPMIHLKRRVTCVAPGKSLLIAPS